LPYIKYLNWNPELYSLFSSKQYIHLYTKDFDKSNGMYFALQ